MSARIAIIDYGMGNLRSVEKALEHVGVTATITYDPGEVRAADGVILPGVGAFPRAMERIRKALLGGHPLIYVMSWEETRVERLGQHLAKTFYGSPCPYGVWSVVDGLVVDGAGAPATPSGTT